MTTRARTCKPKPRQTLLKCYVRYLNFLSVMQSNSSFTDHFHIWEFILTITKKLLILYAWAHSIIDTVFAMNYPKAVIAKCSWITMNIAYPTLLFFSRHILFVSSKQYTFIPTHENVKKTFIISLKEVIFDHFLPKVLNCLVLSLVGATYNC